MRQAPDIVESLPPRAAPALHEIAPGMELKKCRRCGCMNDALNQAVRTFESSDESEIHALLPRISDYQARMEPLAYDCIGCKKCWGADAIIELAKHFDEVELDLCASGDEGASGDSKSSAASSNRCTGASPIASWPPHAGDYLLGHPDGSVAICTLSDRDLPARLTAEPTVEIARR